MLQTGIIVLLLTIGLAFLVLALLICVIIFSEKKTIFTPQLQPEWVDPQELGAAVDEVEDVDITTEDGISLHGWFYRTFLQKLIAKIQEGHEKQAKGASQTSSTTTSTDASLDLNDAKPLIGSPTLLYLHGNSGNISHRFPLIRNLANATQFNVFVMDYRGYGKSEGDPSEEGLKKDAEAMLEALVKRDDIDKERIIVYGQGIGGHLALHLATKESTKKLFQALVIENTFTNIHDMTTTLLPRWLSPLSGLVKSKFDSLALLTENKLEMPALFIATSDDEVVPHAQMKKLFSAARRNAIPECKDDIKMLRYNGTEHHNVPSINEEAFYKNLLEWSCKVLLHENYSDAEMQEIEKGFMGLVNESGDVQPEEPELIEAPEDDDDDNNKDEKDKDKQDDEYEENVADIPRSEIRKRVKTTDTNDQGDN